VDQRRYVLLFFSLFEHIDFLASVAKISQKPIELHVFSPTEDHATEQYGFMVYLNTLMVYSKTRKIATLSLDGQ